MSTSMLGDNIILYAIILSSYKLIIIKGPEQN